MKYIDPDGRAGDDPEVTAEQSQQHPNERPAESYRQTSPKYSQDRLRHLEGVIV